MCDGCFTSKNARHHLQQTKDLSVAPKNKVPQHCHCPAEQRRRRRAPWSDNKYTPWSLFPLRRGLQQLNPAAHPRTRPDPSRKTRGCQTSGSWSARDNASRCTVTRFHWPLFGPSLLHLASSRVGAVKSPRTVSKSLIFAETPTVVKIVKSDSNLHVPTHRAAVMSDKVVEHYDMGMCLARAEATSGLSARIEIWRGIRRYQVRLST